MGGRRRARRWLFQLLPPDRVADLLYALQRPDRGSANSFPREWGGSVD